MSEKRIPKPGEVWTGSFPDETRTVVNVYPDAVTYIYSRTGELYAMTTEQFVGSSTPPAPTVVGSRWLAPNPDTPTDFVTYLIGYELGGYEWPATHRLDLMSDGDFRVVRL